MAQVADITRTVPPRTETRTTIQWGNVIKGVALVAAVAVVAVVGFQLASGFVAANPAVGEALAFVGQGLVSAGEALWGLAQSVGSTLWSFVGGLFPSSMHAAAANSTVIAGGSAVSAAQLGGWIVGGGAALATALFLKLPQNLWNAVSNMFGQERVQIGGKTEVIHQGHSVQDHNAAPKRQDSPQLEAPSTTTETVTNVNASRSNWTDSVPQRAASHGAQIDAEQALSALATNSRSA